MRHFETNLASKTPNASTTFESYINKPDYIMETKQILINELKDALFSLKINKSLGYDDISFNILKKCFSSLCEPLEYMFNIKKRSVQLQANICASLLSKSSRADNVQSFVPIFN